jgi:ATP-dependent exoDNAse (exonuclease V) alpha subunit
MLLTDVKAASPEERAKTLIIAPLRKDRAALNNALRADRQEQGQIGQDQLKTPVLLRGDLTDAEKRQASSYLPGHRKDWDGQYVVQFQSSYSALGIKKGDYARVKSVTEARDAVILERADKTLFTWHPQRQKQVTVFEEETRALAVGDQIRFNNNDRSIATKNGMPGEVSRIDPIARTATIKTTDGDKVLNMDEPRSRHFDYAYALTVYASQGVTASATHILAPTDSGRAFSDRGFYVGITRAEHDLSIYTDDKKKLGELIEPRTDKTSAVESLSQPEPAR